MKDLTRTQNVAEGMGVSRLMQVRILHLLLITLAGISFLIYVYNMNTLKPLITTGLSKNDVLPNFNTNLSKLGLSNKTLSSPLNRLSSPLPPTHTISLESSLNYSYDDIDSSPGVVTELIYESGFIDANAQICLSQGKDLKLLMVITSAPSNEDARIAIRNTWGTAAIRKDVAVAFILGSTTNETVRARLKKEQSLFGDLIQGRFIDTYDNLTLKTISILEWVDKYCPRASYVLKTDDDMFINVYRLLDFIQRRPFETRAIYGRLANKWKPIRNDTSKYYIPRRSYRPTIFPDFTTGPAYLFPANLARELYIAALNRSFFKLEDVFITGMVASDIKIRRIHAHQFLNRRVKLTPCNVQKAISIHMIQGIEQYYIWKKLHDATVKCK